MKIYTFVNKKMNKRNLTAHFKKLLSPTLFHRIAHIYDIYICMCIYIYTYVYIYINIYIYIYIYIYISKIFTNHMENKEKYNVYIYIYVCIYIYTYFIYTLCAVMLFRLFFDYLLFFNGPAFPYGLDQ